MSPRACSRKRRGQAWCFHRGRKDVDAKPVVSDKVRKLIPMNDVRKGRALNMPESEDSRRPENGRTGNVRSGHIELIRPVSGPVLFSSVSGPVLSGPVSGLRSGSGPVLPVPVSGLSRPLDENGPVRRRTARSGPVGWVPGSTYPRDPGRRPKRLTDRRPTKTGVPSGKTDCPRRKSVDTS